jgi:tetratricopeptide (TPR) repeat protein
MIPSLPDPALQAVRAHLQAGRIAVAEAICRQALARQANQPEAHYWLGVIAIAVGRYEAALDWLGQAVADAPEQAAYHGDLGVAYRLLGRTEEALGCFHRALILQADLPDAHLNLGEALISLERFDEAIPSLERALALRPNDAVAYNHLGSAQAQARRREEAIASFRRALALQPNYGEAHNNLGNVFLAGDEWEDAVRCYRRALELQPGDAEAWANLGLAWLGQAEFEAAMDCYRRAIAARPDFPDAHLHLAFLLLLHGRYAEGWREYEWRWRCAAPARLRPRFAVPPWDGGLLPGGTILLYAEQGFGDTLQFFRYLPLVRARAGAARVIVVCSPPLARLLAECGVEDVEVVAARDWETAVLPRFDRHLPLLSLPLALGIDAPRPMAAPYLRADPAWRAPWRDRLGASPAFRVGVVWAGSRGHKDDRRRSLELERLRPVLRVPGVTFYSLQIDRRGESPQALTEAGLIDFTEHLTDFAETAALLAELDLVIAVDTATVHLAGALGRPVWTLLPFIPDWRWGLQGETTPWYPTMRLFRQPAIGDWDAAIQRVADELMASRG